MKQDGIKKKYGTTPEEQLLGARLVEMAERTAERGFAQQSDFLSPAERALCLSIPEIPKLCTLTFDGGYPEAERTVAVFTPRGQEPEPAALSALALEYRGEALGHRDLLGALMALGIRREKLGDIIAHVAPPILICDIPMAHIVVQQLERAGRNRITATETTPADIPPPATETVTFTVMSPRLDSVVAESFRLSRSDAADRIAKGLVTLNWKVCDAAAKNVGEGDRIALRGSGKIAVAEIGGQSRKGRTFMRVLRYL